ncbi:hypothetical protein LX36DRAFT_664117, partial [Colletotrichum falcatum]
MPAMYTGYRMHTGTHRLSVRLGAPPPSGKTPRSWRAGCCASGRTSLPVSLLDASRESVRQNRPVESRNGNHLTVLGWAATNTTNTTDTIHTRTRPPPPSPSFSQNRRPPIPSPAVLCLRLRTVEKKSRGSPRGPSQKRPAPIQDRSGTAGPSRLPSRPKWSRSKRRHCQTIGPKRRQHRRQGMTLARRDSFGGGGLFLP